MSTTINLGPSNVNRPLEEEKIAIRDSLDLGSASLLYGSFNFDGDAITFENDGVNPTKSITIRLADLEGTLATKLKDSRRFYLSGGTITSQIEVFDGTSDVVLNANLADRSVTREKIVDGEIIASKIANLSITPGKLSTGAPSWDSNTTYLNRALELGNSIVVDTNTYIDFHSVRANAGADLTDYDARLIRWAGVDGKLDLINTGTGTLGFTANNYSLKTIGDASTAITIPNTGDITITRSINIGSNTFKGNATSANTAARLANEVTITLSGVISGDAKFTGATGSTTPSITTTFANASLRAPSTSLNDITSTGFYRGDSTNTNRPAAITAGNYDILHVQSSATAASQLLFASIGQVYWRIRNGASWGIWNNVIDSANIPIASTTIKGIVELATNAETIAGISATLAVTPASLASLTATTTRAGLVKLSESDMLSLADWNEWSALDDVAATPKAVAARILAIPPTSTAIPGGDAGGDLTGVYPNPSIRAASVDVAGKIKISSNTDALNGLSTTLAVTPANLKHVLDNSSSSTNTVNDANKILRRNASNNFAINQITSSAISVGTGVSPTAPLTIQPKIDADNTNPYKNSLHIYNPETETTTSGTVSINGITNVITVSTVAGLANNGEIIFTGLTNTTGIVTGVSYFVRDLSGRTFKISKNIGGDAIVITTTGTGTGNVTWRSARQNSIISVATSGLNGGDPFVSFDITLEAGWSAGVDNTDTNKFKIASDYNDLANDTRVTITTDGKVGIGTTTPTEQLEVIGSIKATGTVGFKGNLTGNVIGDLDGNAKTATTTATAETANKLKTAINIVFTGDVAGKINAFDGSASVSNTLTIASDAVVSAKIKDGAVTASKLSTGGPAWGGIGSGSFNVSQPALELGLGITTNVACLIDFHSSSPVVDHDARILRNSGVNGNLDIINIGTGHINISSGGRVGINKSSPEEIFHVNGPIFLEGGTANTGLLTVDANNRTNTYAVFGSNGSSSDWAYLRQIGGNNNLTISLDLHDDSNSGTGGQGFKIRTVASSAAGATDPAPIDRFSIDGNGDIGINSTATRGKLTVVDDDNSLTGSASTLALSVRGTSQGEKPNLSFYSTFMATPLDNGPRRTADIVAGYNGGSWGKEYLTFNVGGSSDVSTRLTAERMRITADGFVGIGTNAPTSMLHVNGDILSGGNMIINNGSPTLFLKDTNHRSAMVHVNNNEFYVLRGKENNSTEWSSINGRWPMVLNLETNNATFGGTGNFLGGVTIDGGDYTNKFNANQLTFADSRNSSRYFMGTRGTQDGTNANWKFYYYNTQGGTNNWPIVMHVAPSSLNSNAYSLALKDNTLVVDKDNQVGIGTLDPKHKLQVEGNVAVRGSAPTIGFIDTTQGTYTGDNSNTNAYIHVNNGGFHILTGNPATDDGTFSWATVKNNRWPLYINLNDNNAAFGGDVNAISFTSNTVNATTITGTTVIGNQVKTPNLTLNGNQVNSNTGELALNYQKADGTNTNFINTTIFNGKNGLVTKFYGDSGYQYNTGNLEINNGSPTIYLRDINNRSAMVHVNNNEFYVLRGKQNNSTDWVSHNGQWPMVLNLETNNATFGGEIRSGNSANLGGKLDVWKNGQDSWGSAGILSNSTVGDAGISLHASGATAAFIKHPRGGNGIEVYRADGALANIKADYVNGNTRSTNQLQAFTADNFTGGDHYIKAIREDGWWTRLKTCYLNGGATTNDVRVGYADNAGYANNYPNRYFIPHGSIWTVQESSGKWGNISPASAYYTTNDAYIDFALSDLAGAGFLYNGANYAIYVEVRRYNGDLLAQEGFYPTGNSIGRTRVLSNINTSKGAGGGSGKDMYTQGVHVQVRDHHSGKMSAIWGIDFLNWFSKQNQINF